MPIYRNILRNEDFYSPIQNKIIFEDIKNCYPSPDDVYYYGPHDLSLNHIQFSDFIADEHWDYIKKTNTVKILINFCNEYLNILDINRISETIIEKGIDPKQIHFIVMDKNFLTFVHESFKKNGINEINIIDYNSPLVETNINLNSHLSPTHKFSFLSRRYTKWRLYLVLNLIENDNLNNFIYTFHDHQHSEKHPKVSIDEIKSDTLTFGFDLSGNIADWLNNIPYTSDIVEKQNLMSPSTNKLICMSDFHLIIETLFDPFLDDIFGSFSKNYHSREFSRSLISEKTWKCIASKKPFIVASTPFFLQDLKNLGFKTFSHLINESYDLIEDNYLRIKSLTDEIHRICCLSEKDYNDLKIELNEITNYNYKRLVDLKNQQSFNINKIII